MPPFSAVAIFCEDIREEKSGQDTIVGTMTDNLGVPAPPPSMADAPNAALLLPKLGVYLRINFAAEDKPNQLSVKITNTDGTLLTEGGWNQDVLDKTFLDAQTGKATFAGLIFKIVVAPLVIKGAGKITVVASVDGVDYVVGVLNIILSANVSPPPV